MAEELWQTLARFHREVIAPDLRKMVGEELVSLREEIAASRRDNERHFDAIYKRFDRLESEVAALTAAVKRLEEEVAALKRSNEEHAAGRAEARQELDQIKARIAELQKQVAELEAQIS